MLVTYFILQFGKNLDLKNLWNKDSLLLNSLHSCLASRASLKRARSLKPIFRLDFGWQRVSHMTQWIFHWSPFCPQKTKKLFWLGFWFLCEVPKEVWNSSSCRLEWLGPLLWLKLPFQLERGAFLSTLESSSTSLFDVVKTGFFISPHKRWQTQVFFLYWMIYRTSRDSLMEFLVFSDVDLLKKMVVLFLLIC